MVDEKISAIIDGARSEKKMDMRQLVYDLFPDFFEMHGDRVSGDDKAIISGFGSSSDRSIAVIATNKGKNTEERLITNFGCPLPMGYRKSLRIMKLAENIGCPILTLINTPGAYPGASAENNGQGQVIAKCIGEMISLHVPILSVIIGEAGSGGALALACSDEILMFEHSMYTILSPEGFAAIMWNDSKKANRAAELMHIDPTYLKKQGIINQVLSEKLLDENARGLKELIDRKLDRLYQIDRTELMKKRKEKFRKY